MHIEHLRFYSRVAGSAFLGFQGPGPAPQIVTIVISWLIRGSINRISLGPEGTVGVFDKTDLMG